MFSSVKPIIGNVIENPHKLEKLRSVLHGHLLGKNLLQNLESIFMLAGTDGARQISSGILENS